MAIVVRWLTAGKEPELANLAIGMIKEGRRIQALGR